MIKQLEEIFDESREKELIISADSNFELKWGDKLVVFDRDENIEIFKKD